VVIKEIESWYYAGLSIESVQNLNVPSLPFTDDLTKEDFNRLIPKKYDSRIDFMFEILKYFSIDAARKKNCNWLGQARNTLFSYRVLAKSKREPADQNTKRECN
jgi:hypothetical protein